jgi:GT2 family glycosyltransferase
VNDGSDRDTTEFLRAFAGRYVQWSLHENPAAVRYTRAANAALRDSTADYVVLLNSDTIVPHKWLRSLIEHGERAPDAGLIGPLSNAATWQSIPQVHDECGDWKVNALPDNVSVDSMAAFVETCSTNAAPEVPMLNGFCLAIKRSVIERIGLLDAESFPDGYGEEIDYCFRAADAGFRAIVADSVYVFHAKSRSYGHELRRELAARGRAVLESRHGAERFRDARSRLRNDPVLAAMRARIERVLNVLT